MVRSVFHVDQRDPVVAPLPAGPAIECSGRYGGSTGEVHADLVYHPAAEFATPHGDPMVMVEDGEPVAGGAFRHHDARTAGLKHIWIAREHRRRGPASFVLVEFAHRSEPGDRRDHAVAGHEPAGEPAGDAAGAESSRSGPRQHCSIGPGATTRGSCRRRYRAPAPCRTIGVGRPVRQE